MFAALAIGIGISAIFLGNQGITGSAPPTDNFLLQENGFYLLQENGFKIIIT